MAASVDKFSEQLFAADVDTRLQAAEALGQLGEEAQDACLALVRACADPAEEVREAVIGALESVGPPASTDIGGLIELLDNENAESAYWAATLLGRLGAAAVSSVPALIRVLVAERPPAVRERAAWALGMIGPAAKDAADALDQIAKQSGRLARLAQEALDQIRA